jgi:hypothetical protein
MGEVVAYFLRLGLLGFGGPVALVGQMERERVAKRKWLSNEQMREAIAICQSLPGPLAIQVGIYVTYLRAGFWGAWAGGWAFIFPNFVIVAALGALYVYLGEIAYPLLQPTWVMISRRANSEHASARAIACELDPHRSQRRIARSSATRRPAVRAGSTCQGQSPIT